VHETAIMAPPLNAALATRWIGDGTLPRLIAQVRAEAMLRQSLAARILSGIPYRAHPEGYHLWLPVPVGASPAHVVNTLRPAGISVVASEDFAVDPGPTPPALRVSIGGSLSHERLTSALKMLDVLLDQGTERKTTLV